MQTEPHAAGTIEEIFRREHGLILAALIARYEDFTLAEDALQDALVNALESWPENGVPRNPGAWLLTVSRRRAVDRLRRAVREQNKTLLLDLPPDEDPDEVEMNTIPDERLKLMFACCHPALAREAQVALTLHTLAGLSTRQVARAFLVSEPTMAQRLARARRKIREAGIPFRIPPADLLPERTDALLAVIYLIFNEGYAASGGEVSIQSELCDEAIRLGRVLVELLPDEAEARGLLALMLLHDSRRETRLDSSGNLVLLADQDRSRWDTSKIEAGLRSLHQALAMAQPGPYQVQAAISALHATAATAGATDWPQIVALYDRLYGMLPSMVVAVNRSVAIAMAFGPQKGLQALEDLGQLAENFYPYHAARADLLRRANQREAAAASYRRALALCSNPAERAYLQRRLDEVQSLAGK